MPRPPDYQNQMGRGGAAGPNQANPLIPKVIRAGPVGKPKTTTQQSGGRYRTETTVTAAEGVSMDSLSVGPVTATPADSSGEWVVTAYAFLPSDIPDGVLTVVLAGGVDSVADDRRVGPDSHRATAVVITTGPIAATAGYTPDSGFTPSADIGMRLVTNARRV